VCVTVNLPGAETCASCSSDAVLSSKEIRLLRLGRLTPATVAQHRKRRLVQHDTMIMTLLDIIFFFFPWRLFERRKRQSTPNR
jgi:hypothetical protein